MKKNFASAHDISADPDLYNRVWIVGKYTLECNGYSKTGNSIRFSDVIPTDDGKLILILRYIHPDKVLQEA